MLEMPSSTPRLQVHRHGARRKEKVVAHRHPELCVKFGRRPPTRRQSHVERQDQTPEQQPDRVEREIGTRTCEAAQSKREKRLRVVYEWLQRCVKGLAEDGVRREPSLGEERVGSGREVGGGVVEGEGRLKISDWSVSTAIEHS